MKVTVYSSDPIEDALHVVGALYGVRLEVSANEVSSSNGNAGAAAPSRSRPRAKAAAATVKAPRGRSARASVLPSTAELRAWARAHDHQVNDRGPLPADIAAAYAAAN